MDEELKESVTTEQEGASMGGVTAMQDIVIQLKKIKEKQGLSVMGVKKLVDATGYVLGESTYRRLFKEGSEINDSFRYDDTLRPIAEVLLPLGENEDPELLAAKIETYDAICRHKNEVIQSLQAQIGQIKADYETRCREYEKRMAFLRDQIEKKDQRMDRKDEIISKLLEKVL